MKRLLTLIALLALCALPALAEHVTPTPVPALQTDAGTASAIATVDSFFYFWRVAGEENLLSFAAPSWRNAQADPQAALSAICAGRTPTALAEILSASGASEDAMRTVRAKVTMRSGADGTVRAYIFTVIVVNEEGRWYVDPQSMALHPGATATPTPAPAADSVTVCVDGTPVAGYTRETPLNMPAGEDYLNLDIAVSTWRGGSSRINAASGTLAQAPASMESLWMHLFPASAGQLFAERMQPTIIQWPIEIRQMMNITDEAKATIALKEVLIPTLDGAIRCLDLASGTPTRTLRTGAPMMGSVTLHPLAYPVLLAGQGTPLQTEAAGMHLLSAADGSSAAFVADEASSAFITSALIDQSTNTAVFLSEAGWLFTQALDTRIMMDSASGALEAYAAAYHTVSAKVSASPVTTAPVMQGSRLWLGNAAGKVICIDTTTMQPLWTVEGMHGVSALAMRETVDGPQLLAVTGLGEAHLYVLAPDTGAITADIPLTLHTPGPCLASAPVVGQESLDGLVFVNLTGTSDNTAGLAELCAIDMEIGMISWRVGYPDSIALTAPAAVYDGEGNGYLITVMEGEETTILLLMEGATGVIRSTLTLPGNAPCSPAVYGDMLILTTNSDGGSMIHGVRLNPETAE